MTVLGEWVGDGDDDDGGAVRWKWKPASLRCGRIGRTTHTEKENNKHTLMLCILALSLTHTHTHIELPHTDRQTPHIERQREEPFGDHRREKVKKVQAAAEMACALLRRAASSSSSSSSHRPLASLFSAFTAGPTRGFSSDSALQIKALRERTGALIKDVKAALLQCEWDAEAAMLELRKKGLTAASRKTSRAATDGLLAVANAEGVTAVVEINSETDFVARNEMFRHLATRVARAAIGIQAQNCAPGSAATVDLPALEAIKITIEHEKFSGEATVQEAVTQVAAIMGENVRLRRGFLVSSPTGIVSSYLHASAHPGLARVVGLVTLEPEDGVLKDQEAEAQLGSALAMHVVAAKPLFLSKDLVPETYIHSETDIFRTQALSSGKPPNVVEKMMQGRLRKYFEETVLLDQKFVINDSINVQAVLDDHHKQTGRRVSISNFLRMEVGEGMQQKEE